jgi:ubiquitin-like 1-activating enzyme E1 B
LNRQLFGEDEDASGEVELTEALQRGENGVLVVDTIVLFAIHNHLIAQEIATLRKEAQAFKRVRTALRSPNDNEEAAKLAFEKACRCAGFG